MKLLRNVVVDSVDYNNAFDLSFEFLDSETGERIRSSVIRLERKSTSDNVATKLKALMTQISILE